jgi:hypothetical protein
MANPYIKYSTSLSTTEVQLQPHDMSTHLSQKVKTKIETIPNAGKDSEKLNFSHFV